MAETPASPDAGEEQDVGPDRDSTTGTPRWVKVFGLIALVVVVLFVVVMLIGGGHGPGRHTSGGGSDTPGGHIGPPPGFEHGGQLP
jgi:hypothetical protein